MHTRSLLNTARKTLIRRGRAILRLRQDFQGTPPEGEEPDYLAGLAEVERDELAQIHAALERIDQGTYGHCQACGCLLDEDALGERPLLRTCAHCRPRAAASL